MPPSAKAGSGRTCYYRLNTVSIHVPALRERREDIPILVEQLTAAQAAKNTPAAAQIFQGMPGGHGPLFLAGQRA